MYENFGAKPQADHPTRVEFNVFLPDNQKDPTQYVRGGRPQIRRILVRGTFQHLLGGNDWELNPALELQETGQHPSGLLYRLAIATDLPEGYYEYKYFVEFENDTTRWVKDPVSKYGGSDDSDSSAFVIGGNTVVVRPIARRLAPMDLILYELHIGDWTSQRIQQGEAPVDCIARSLDYFDNLGVNAIEFMPWTAFPPGEYSWGYDPVDFFSVEYSYINDGAAPADKLVKLGRLINAMHDRGLHVIMDGVFNHVRAGTNPNQGFGYKWLYLNPEESPFIGAFAGVAFFDDFDYNNRCTQEFIRDICTYWLDVFQVDGIRFDYTLGFFRRGDQDHGITRLIRDLTGYESQTQRSNIAHFIEHLTDDRYEAIADTNEICASGCWFDPFMYKNWQYGGNSNIDAEILRILNANSGFATGKGPVTYIENHDHSYITRAVGGRQRWFKTQPPAIALLTSPGAVMIRSGQEFGEDYGIPESGDDRVVARPLEWNTKGPAPMSNDPVGNQLFAIYRKLIGIRKDHPALRSSNFFPYPDNIDGYGAFFDQDVVIFHRWGTATDGRLERFIVAINYSDFDQRIDIPFPTNGRWDDLLNDIFVMVSDLRLPNQLISSSWGRIYWQAA